MCPETGLGRKKNIKSDREMDNLFFILYILFPNFYNEHFHSQITA